MIPNFVKALAQLQSTQAAAAPASLDDDAATTPTVAAASPEKPGGSASDDNTKDYTRRTGEPVESHVTMNAVIENRPYHEHFMREAINMAERALATDETPVGCVFVRNGEIIGRGMNDTNKSLNGTRHAEFVAIEQILSMYNIIILREADLYVTVEPCIMCASALRQYGIRSVYFGCANDKFGGTGGVMNIHSDWSIDTPYPVYGGIFREEAIMLLRRFYIQENGKAPEPHRKGTRELKTDIKPLPGLKSLGKALDDSTNADKENVAPALKSTEVV